MLKEFKTGTFNLNGETKINRLGFGAMRITGQGIWGLPKNVNESISVLHRVVDLGINFIDTADAYGPFVSEELIAKALYPYPAELVIATKGGLVRTGPGKWNPDGSPKHLREALEGSLKRLKKDTIDLYQLHRIDPVVPVEDSVGTMAAMQKEGKIRYIGVSNFNVEEFEKVKDIAKIVTVQNQYNLAYRRDEPVLNYCTENNIGYIPWFPLEMGKLAKDGEIIKKIAKKYGATTSQIAISWLLKKSHVMLPIPGTSTVSHLEENTLADEIVLNDSDFDEIDNLSNENINLTL